MNRGFSSAGQLSNKRRQVAVWRQRLEGDGVGGEAPLSTDELIRILPGHHLFWLKYHYLIYNHLISDRYGLIDMMTRVYGLRLQVGRAGCEPGLC